MPGFKVKPIEQSAEKWVRNAGSASGEYAQEAEAAAAHWQSRASGAGKDWKAGVTEGGAESRFTSGVQRAGASKYARGIREKGASRYSGGVSAGKDDYAARTQPYMAALASVDAPERGLRGDPKNLQRVSKGNEALHKLRLQRTGAGR